MANWRNIFIGTGIGAGILITVGYFSRMKRTAKQLESLARVSVHSIKADGLTIRIDVDMKNPSNGKLKLKFPFVKLLYQDSVIGASQASDQTITVPAHGQAKIMGIMVNIPAAGLLKLGGAFFDLWQNKKEIGLAVKTITTVDLGFSKLPYEKTDKTTLKPTEKSPAKTLKPKA